MVVNVAKPMLLPATKNFLPALLKSFVINEYTATVIGRKNISTVTRSHQSACTQNG